MYVRIGLLIERGNVIFHTNGQCEAYHRMGYVVGGNLCVQHLCYCACHRNGVGALFDLLRRLQVHDKGKPPFGSLPYLGG